MIIEQAPPGEMPEGLNTYFQRMWLNVEKGINATQSVFLAREIPDNPVEGVLYYLLEDIPDVINATQGFWYWTQEVSGPGIWEKLAVGSDVIALEARVSALENP